MSDRTSMHLMAADMTSKRWSTSTKIVVTAILCLLAVVLLVTFRAMIRPTIIAFLLAFVLHQPVNWVQQRTGWSRAASIVAIYLLVVLLLVIAPVIFVPRLAASFESLVSLLETLITDLETASTGPLLSIGGFELSVDNLLQQLGAVLQSILSPAATSALGLALTLTTTVLTSLYVLVLGFWLLKDMNKLQRTLMGFLPVDYREDARGLGRELAAIWSAFLRGQFLLGIVVGLITWIVMTIVGLPNPAGLALLAGVMEFLPTVGPGISGTIGTLSALFQGSTWLPLGNLPFALIVLALYVVITQVESVYLIPRLVGRRVHLHPAVTFTGIISAAVTFGVLGVLLITPTIASARTILGYVLRKLQDREPFEPTYRQSDVRIPGLIAGHRIEAVIFDLDGVLTPLDWSFAEEMAARFVPLERIWTREQRLHFFRRLMAFLEGPIAGLLALLSWLQLHDDVQRMTPFLNRLRGFPPAEELRLHEGLHPVLVGLSHQYRLGLITTRCRQDVEQFLGQSGLPPTLFDAVVTREDMRNPAPNSAAFVKALERMEVQADAALIIGDTELKLRAGEAVGAVQVGVLCGMDTEQDFDNADLVLDSSVELADYL